MDCRSLLLLAVLHHDTTLIWIQLFAAILKVTPVVEVSVPQTIVDRWLKDILCDKLTQKLFNACNICERCILHHTEKILYFIRSVNISIEIKTLISLDHRIYHCLVFTVDQSKHLSDSTFSVRKAISVKELKDTNYFYGILNCLRRQHHDQKSTSIVHLCQKLSKLKICIFDGFSVLNKVLLLAKSLLSLLILLIITDNNL